MLATDFPPGFANPVFDNQATFRVVLHALAHPGTVCELPVALEAPPPLTLAAAAVCLALFDVETPVWLQARSLEPWLRFHCGAPVVTETLTARFAVIHDPYSMPALSEFERGSDECPDRSATLLIQVDAFIDGGARMFSGPGIRERVAFDARGLRSNFWDEWRENTLLFPCGVDLVFTTGRHIAALPRTARMEG
jgi:alpha-D-ribose 1-methylphosphonate 5-triphosphate synthase subunit PhnH